VLLALGPLQLDTASRTVVVGLADRLHDPTPAGADAAWLAAPTAERVATLAGAGLPVGVTVVDVAMLPELVHAGAVAVAGPDGAVVDAAVDLALTLWCTPAQAARAATAGVPPDRVVCEPGDPGAAPVAGTTVEGDGPAAWGQVIRHVLAGARVVRTTDVASVRRVVTVLDRLVAARGAGRQEASP
jgi:hypothetical protein